MIKKLLIYNSGGGIGDSIQLFPLILTLQNLFKESEKNKKNGKEGKSLESFEGAIKFSELAENYSTVYSVWCRG